jgi:hypothetical protein
LKNNGHFFKKDQLTLQLEPQIGLVIHHNITWFSIQITNRFLTCVLLNLLEDKLLKLEDSLSLSRTKFVLIDCFANVKGFTIFDMKETRMDLFNLYHDHLHQRVQSGQIRLVLF